MANYSTYSADYPQHIAPRDYDITSATPTMVSTSQSLKRVTTSRGAHRFGVRFNYAAMTRDEFMPIWAFLMNQNGQAGDFTVALPNQEPRGTLATAPSQQLRLNAEATRGSTSLVLKNFANSETDAVKAGDFFNITGNKKTYIAISDATSDSTGLLTLDFFPKLQVDAAQDTIINFEPVINVSLSNDLLSVNIPASKVYNFNIEFVERI